MRNLLLLGIAALLGASLSAPGTANSPAVGAVGSSVAGNVDFSAPGAGDSSSTPGTANFFASVSAALSASASLEAGRPACFGQRATLVGSSGNDVIEGTPRRDVIVAGAGHDVIRSLGGVDFVCAGAGNDRLYGGPNPNNFTLTRDPSRGDRLAGGEGNDLIVDGGGGYRDLLLGGPGDDRLMAAGGGYAESRTLNGGPGADRLTSYSTDASLLGGSGPDTLTSRGHRHFVAGGAGTDVLTLAGSGDTVLGLDADGDQVRIRGARYVVLLLSPGPVEVDLAAGSVRRVGAVSGDVITGLSRPKPPRMVVYGTEGDDVLSGWDFGDMVIGRGGNDVLAGRGGGDVLDGGNGNDSADGGPGVDTCFHVEQMTSCTP
jgi:Ca2+-binding RTX toxin-like protein